jgi:hypothetical protein
MSDASGDSSNAMAPWYWVLGVLFIGLAVAALYRLILKLRADGGTVKLKSRIVFGIYVALVAYGTTRGVVVILEALDKVPRNQDLSQTMFDMIPAVLFCVLQTALVAKWVGHVSDVTYVLRHEVFAWRRPIIFASVIGCIITVLLTIATLGDRAHSSPYVSESTWVQILNSSTGMTYCMNGLLFASLGIILRSNWQPTSESDVAACRRILAIAVLFGGVCMIRGIGLIAFAGQDRESSQLVSSHWGAPLMLTVEWVALVTSLFGLTNVGGSAAGEAATADVSTSEPMIGSNRNIFGSTRRITFATRSISSTSNGQQLRSMPIEDEPYRGQQVPPDSEPSSTTSLVNPGE